MKKTLRLFSLFTFVLILAAPFVRAEDQDYGAPAGTVVVPEGLTEKEVQRCIGKAGADRGWTIRSRDDEKVVLFLEKGRWVSNLTLVYNTKEIQIYSKSTRNGKPKIPDWVDFLKKSINIELNNLAISK